ncbi:MAG TPA: hypothetical protein VL485_14900 [Ktedonobacteraceae bacterium]|jgi:hypothetical protein|nr:hypothetical protein [Ktedonobacteraceae bacterium]
MEATTGTVAVQQSVSPATTEQLTPKQLYSRDLLFVLLRDVLHWNDVTVVVVTMIISVLLVFFPPLIWDFGLKTADIVRDLLQALIAFPLLAFQCLRLPAAIADLFNSLRARNIVGDCRDDQSVTKTYAQFLQRLVAQVDSPWWTVGAIVLVVAYAVYRLISVDQFTSVLQPRVPMVDPVEVTQQTQQFMYRIGFLVLYSIMLYSAFIAIARMLVALLNTSALFRTFKINVNPLHPDGSGGLGTIEQMLGVSVGIVTTIGIIALLVNASFLAIPKASTSGISLWEAAIVGLLYLSLAPTLLLGWLFAPHQVMQDARDAVLQPLADQFQATINSTTPSSSEDAGEIKRGTDRMAELKRRYDLLQETFPIWPAQIQVVRRMFATLSLPAILPFLSLLGPALVQLSQFIGDLFSSVK